MKSVNRLRVRAATVQSSSLMSPSVAVARTCSRLRSQQRDFAAPSTLSQSLHHVASRKGKERSVSALPSKLMGSSSPHLRSMSTSSGPTHAAPARLGMDSEVDLGRHFYLNKVLEQWAAKPATRMTLRQLIFFGRTLGRDREKILKSANYVRSELPIRIAHRIRDLQALPFVVMTNTHLEDVYQKYWSAFETFRRFPHIRTMDDNEKFCNLLRGLLDDHLTIIPSLTIGIVESSHHLQPRQLDKFMERMLRSRISRRVLAEQHIALTEALDDPFHFFNEPDRRGDEGEEEVHDDAIGDHVGIIYTRLSVASVVNKGIKLLTKMFADVQGVTEDRIPKVEVDGDLKARFAYIPEHLEYIVFELLKNAIRATIRRHVGEEEAGRVRVTVVEGPPEEDLIIRISDGGGGLPDLISRLEGPSRVTMAKQPTASGFASSPSPGNGSELSLQNDQQYPIPFPDTGHIGGYPPRGSRARMYHPDDETMPVTLSDDPLPIPARIDPTSFYAEDWIEPAVPASSTPIRGGVGSAGGVGGTTPPNEFGTVGTSTSSDTGYSDIIDALCSFSNVRKRLEIEALLPTTPSPSPSPIPTPLPTNPAAHLTHAGLGTRSRFDALKSIGKFKGTVTEQTKIQAMEGTGPAALQVQVETGLGLPMAKVYCDFFGGSLSFRSLDGHSTDIYVRLPKLGTNKETIEEIVL